MGEGKTIRPEGGLKGVVEDVKGRLQETAGAVADKDALRDGGRAQQDKEAAERR